MVGEFPELQGVMGRYYALHDKEDAEIADAIRDHYKPVGPSDAVPAGKISISVALADKLDALTGFFAAGEKPTGSSDPFALRRAALGVISLLLENKIQFSLRDNIRHGDRPWAQSHKGAIGSMGGADLLPFFADRLKVALREKGIRHDLIDAVFALGGEDDLVRLVARVEALQAFLKSDDGANLLAGYKRAANILKAEEKRDGKTFSGKIDEGKLTEPAEKTLFAALKRTQAAIAPALEKENFADAMRQLAVLRGPVDAFFEGVTVNAEDAKVRENRLQLLAALRAAIHVIGDFSKIEGGSV
jgi:glycyl-tRNA synthetase beta chain